MYTGKNQDIGELQCGLMYTYFYVKENEKANRKKGNKYRYHVYAPPLVFLAFLKVKKFSYYKVRWKSDQLIVFCG